MSDLANKQGYDLVIVGAGLSGIVAARRYLQAHPKARLVILEKDYCLGGVWSERRIYDNFWTQWTYGVSEFSDMAMEKPPEEDVRHGQFKARYTTQYLEAYADKTLGDGSSVRDRIRFNTQVRSIDKHGAFWRLSCRDSGRASVIAEYYSLRLLIANGSGSIPNMPDFPGKENFDGPILHAIDFGQSSIIGDEYIYHVAVIGAGKSSADMIYEAVKAGKRVSWIIRKSGVDGTGPAFFAPADAPTAYENAGLAAQTRIMASFQPSIFNPDTWWTRFLNRTTVGVSIVKWIFHKADAIIRKRAGYRERDASKGFNKLEYETELFWQNGTGGVVHHADFWPLVAQNVFIYRASIKMLNAKELYLDDEHDTHFPCDAVLCGTGYTRELDIFSPDMVSRLGLPHPKGFQSQDDDREWEKLIMDADATILKKYTILTQPPRHPHKQQDCTPYKLYRGMAPLNDDSILFLNHINIANKLFGAEAQAMWAVAFFDGNIALPSIQERRKAVAKCIAWCRRRYLSNGQLGNCFVFDGVPYVDTLLEDMGLKAHLRKGWLKNFFAPFRPADLGRAWDEYLLKYFPNGACKDGQ